MGKGYTNNIELLFALKVICKGSNITKYQEPQEYCPACSNDIIFMIRNKLSGQDEVIGGFQVKAITKGEKESIIIPMLHRRYKYVITVFYSSYNKCKEKVEKLVDKGRIGQETADSILCRIITSRNLGKHIEESCEWLYSKLCKMNEKGRKLEKVCNEQMIDGMINYCISTLQDNHIYIPCIEDFIEPQPLIQPAGLEPQPLIQPAGLEPQPLIQPASLGPQPLIQPASLKPQPLILRNN